MNEVYFISTLIIILFQGICDNAQIRFIMLLVLYKFIETFFNLIQTKNTCHIDIKIIVGNNIFAWDLFLKL